MPVSTMEAWEARTGARLLELWGMTELSGPATSHTMFAPPKLGSIGVSLPGTEIRIASLTDSSQNAPDRGARAS